MGMSARARLMTVSSLATVAGPGRWFVARCHPPFAVMDDRTPAAFRSHAANAGPPRRRDRGFVLSPVAPVWFRATTRGGSEGHPGSRVCRSLPARRIRTMGRVPEHRDVEEG